MYPYYLSITRSSPPLASFCISTCNSSKLSSYALVSLLALALILRPHHHKSHLHSSLSTTLHLIYRLPTYPIDTSPTPMLPCVQYYAKLSTSVQSPFIICDSHQLYKSSALRFIVFIPSNHFHIFFISSFGLRRLLVRP
jgi:hypothetical protein